MSEEKEESKFEMFAGLVLALFAAILAIVDLYGGKYGDDEIIGTNEKASAFSWYQSKSMKQNMLEQEAGLLGAMLEAGAVAESARASVQEKVSGLKKDIDRYKKEKDEILKGTATVGAANHVLDREVVGAQEWETKLKVLGDSGDLFDLATLYLQICLVLGAISLLFSNPKMRVLFFVGMVVLGVVGGYYGFSAYNLAMTT